MENLLWGLALAVGTPILALAVAAIDSGAAGGVILLGVFALLGLQFNALLVLHDLSRTMNGKGATTALVVLAVFTFPIVHLLLLLQASQSIKSLESTGRGDRFEVAPESAR